MKEKIKDLNIFKLVIIVAAIIGAIGLFLPYEKSIGEYRKTLKEYPNVTVIKELNYKGKDVINISIMENFRMYNYTMNHSNGDEWIKGESIINVVFTIAIIASIILILVFAIFNRRILTIVFDIILVLGSLLMNYDIVDRGVMPSEHYTYGISYYLYVIIAVVILVCTIILMVQNKKAKKQSLVA